MRASRRWLAALLVVLGLVSGSEGILLAHVHHAAGPLSELSAASESGASGLAGCAACQARATLDSLAIDAHPERHGAAPVEPPLAGLCAAPAAPRVETPPARGPPLRIV